MRDSEQLQSGAGESVSGLPRTKSAQREATRRLLLAVGREAFQTHGYAGAALEDVAGTAGVTRGALYHHFKSKKGLFRAVLEEVHAEIGRQVEDAADRESDGWQALLAGCRAFIVAANDPAVQRIMLTEGPSVLGWSEWRRMDTDHSLRLLQEELEMLTHQGILDTTSPQALGHLLSGAMNELALWVAQSDHPTDALHEALVVFEQTLDGMRRK